jgi:hypothetical protein
VVVCGVVDESGKQRTRNTAQAHVAAWLLREHWLCSVILSAASFSGKFPLIVPPYERTLELRAQNFPSGGGGGLRLYIICLILKIVLQKSCCKHNITLPATAFIYIRI